MARWVVLTARKEVCISYNTGLGAQEYIHASTTREDNSPYDTYRSAYA